MTTIHQFPHNNITNTNKRFTVNQLKSLGLSGNIVFQIHKVYKRT